MSTHIALPTAAPAMSGARPVSLRRLSSLCDMSPAEELLLQRLKPRTIATGAILTDAAAVGSDTWILLSGWCARVQSPSDSRLITHLLLPGDTVNVLPAQWAGDRLPVVALTPVIAADAAPLRTALGGISSAHGALRHACQRAVACEQAYCLNTIVRLARQTAYERLAHLLLEINARLEAVGLASDGKFQMPVTQDIIAHALGLSLVHLSRTLRQMRKEGTIALRPGAVDLLNPAALTTAAGFQGVASWFD